MASGRGAPQVPVASSAGEGAVSVWQCSKCGSTDQKTHTPELCKMRREYQCLRRQYSDAVQRLRSLVRASRAIEPYLPTNIPGPHPGGIDPVPQWRYCLEQ